jgi:hypothetical protein
MAASAVLAGFVCGAAAQETFRPKTITAQSFVVVDAHGKKRAEFGLWARDKVVLRLYDEQGRVIWSAPPALDILPADISH